MFVLPRPLPSIVYHFPLRLNPFNSVLDGQA